jgi:hypothetical protein
MQLFEAQTLTDSYVESPEHEIKSRAGGVLYVSYVKGAESGLSVLLEFEHESEDNAPDWYQETKTDVSNNVTLVEHKMSATGKYRIPVSGGIGDKKYRVKVKAQNNVAPFGTVSIFAKL